MKRLAAATSENTKAQQSEQAERQVIIARGRRGNGAKNAAAFDNDGILSALVRLGRTRRRIAAIGVGSAFYARERRFVTNALFAFVVRGAGNAGFRGFVAKETTRAIGVGHAALGRHDARMGIDHRVALFTHRAIRILIAHALIDGAVALATTAFRVVGAFLAKLLGTRNIATITG